MASSLDLVAVPGGQVTVSDRRTRRSWQADVGPVELGRSPVTWAEFAEVMGHRSAAVHSYGPPVAWVSWWDAVSYCTALSVQRGLEPVYRVVDDGVVRAAAANGFRLPTEAEWEHACRAGTSGPRYGDLDAVAWYRGNSNGGPHEVGVKAPNGWGLHDLLGNVWEWCWDLYDPEVYGTYRPPAPCGCTEVRWRLLSIVPRPRRQFRRNRMPIDQRDDVSQ